MSRNCYTYLIGWTSQSKFYYGVRYARNCTPDDLWVKYHTSSRFVAECRIEFGEPDIIEIRREFGDNAKSAKKWEDTALRRLNVIKSNIWINRTRNNSFDGISASWNEGLTKETNESLKTVSNKMKKIRKIKKWGTRGVPKTKEHTEKNAWSQIIKHNKNLKLNTYDEFCKHCIDRYQKGIGPFTIAIELGVGGGCVRSALIRQGVNLKTNQSWTKIKKRYPEFQFESYEVFCKYCSDTLKSGMTIYGISKILGLSESTIRQAINSYSSD